MTILGALVPLTRSGQPLQLRKLIQLRLQQWQQTAGREFEQRQNRTNHFATIVQHHSEKRETFHVPILRRRNRDGRQRQATEKVAGLPSDTRSSHLATPQISLAGAFDLSAAAKAKGEAPEDLVRG